MNGTNQVATRIINAEAAFIATLQKTSGCSKKDAKKVMEYYINLKIAKLDAVIGRITVTHGVFLDREIIEKAIEAAN